MDKYKNNVPDENTKKDIKPDFFCSVCAYPFTLDDIRQGNAVKRYHEVLCKEHFKEKYPGECLDHPGTQATVECSHCGALVCDNCILLLGGAKVCRRCKPAILVELSTGQPVEQYSPPEPGTGRNVAVYGILSFPLFVPFGFMAVFYYIVHRRRASRGIDKRNWTADAGLVLSIAAIAFWVFFLIPYISSTFFSESIDRWWEKKPSSANTAPKNTNKHLVEKMVDQLNVELRALGRRLANLKQSANSNMNFLLIREVERDILDLESDILRASKQPVFSELDMLLDRARKIDQKITGAPNRTFTTPLPPPVPPTPQPVPPPPPRVPQPPRRWNYPPR